MNDALKIQFLAELSGPYLEISFYLGKQSYALVDLVKALLKLGTSFTGQALVHSGVGFRDKPFSYITDDLLRPTAIEGISDLEASLSDPDTRLVQVMMDNASGTDQNVREMVTYLSISPEAAKEDSHPVAIWTYGGVFSHAPNSIETVQERLVGEQCYRQFIRLIHLLRPSYGTITIEEELRCPADLRRNPQTGVFSNFYVSAGYLGAARLSQTRNLFTTSYVERIEDGIYISCTKVLNPAGLSLAPRSLYELSCEVAHIVGEAQVRSK